MGFAAEFSNVMVIYTSIVHKPPDVTVCDAYVTDFPLVSLAFFFNVTPNETPSLTKNQILEDLKLLVNTKEICIHIYHI